MTLPIVTIECKAASDPELRFTPAGKAVANLRVVASDRKKDENDQWVDSATLWQDVTAWERLAENVAESVQKGDDLIVIGKIKTEEWDDKDTGAKRSKQVLTAFSIGRNMRWHPVPHGPKAERSSSPAPAAGRDDPWTQAGAAQSDEPPF